MKKDTEILSSFDLKKGLNPKVWVKDNKSTKLKPEIREKLLEIAYEFIEFLGVDIVVSDAHIIGSMVNYNWSKYSDFDLHIIADFEQFPKEQLDLYQELFKLKKTLFNSNHNIKIYGYDVELYVQDSNETYFSSGAYSLIYNKWLSPPKKTDFKADKEVLMSKVNQWTEKIDEVIDSAKGKDLEPALKLLGGFKDKLKKYRQSGLESGGELSYENLVFKYLRRNGYIEKLFNFEKEKVDKELSLEQLIPTKEKIKDFISNLFSGEKNKDGEVKTDDPTKADLVSDNVDEFYKNLESIKDPVSQQQRGKYSFQKDVESIQIGLELLGYKLPVHHVDGLYGPETGGQVEKFKKDNLEEIEKTESTDETNKQSKILPPLNGTLLVGSKFGPRGGKIHKGTDFHSDRNTPIKSPADGKVVGATFGAGNCGGYILIQHSEGYETKYCHCNEIDVSKGEIVTQGQIIGKTGGCNGGKDAGCNGEKEEFSKKGNSTGPHLHFEIILNGTAIDPETVIDKKYIAKYKGNNLVNSVATPEMIKVMIDQLKSKGIKSEDIRPYIDKSENKPVKFSQGQLSNSKEIIDFLVSKGLSAEQSSGIAGNLFKESGFKTDAIGDGGTSYGLAQWHNTRWEDLKKFSSDHNYDLNSIKSQMEFLWYELTNTYKSVYNNLKNTNNAADAATIFASGYERPASKDYTERRRYATNFYQKYTGKDVTSDEKESSSIIKTISDLPKNILNQISILSDRIKKKITDRHIEAELNQEGSWVEDAGSVSIEAKKSIDKLISDARKQFGDRIPNLGVVSGYRSYKDQIDNFASKVTGGGSLDNVQAANTLPGFSQHHTGKAFDIFSTETSWWDANSDIKKWVANNAKKYGFDITYKTKGPLRIAEPWHLYFTSGNSENKPTEKKKSKNYLVYKPNNFNGGEAHVLFAGLHSNQNGQISLNESFYGSGVDPIKGKVLVVITHWGTTVEEAIKHVKENYNATVTSIAGFSKGGKNMWDYVGPRSNMKFVGLIDPSPEGEGQGKSPYINLDFGSNTYMVCNWKNWGNKPPGYVPTEVLKWYCDHKDDSKYIGKVICTDKGNYDHSEIFKNFYNKFADKI